MDILPDCRAYASLTIQRGILGTWVPVFCANCGADGGSVPEENMTFLFYLCNICAETYGHIANLMLMPDEVFWERIKQEQIEAHGRLLTNQELQSIIDANTSPLATLIREGIRS